MIAVARQISAIATAAKEREHVPVAEPRDRALEQPEVVRGRS